MPVIIMVHIIKWIDMKIKGFFFFLLLLYGGYAQAQELRDSVKSISGRGTPCWTFREETTNSRWIG